MGKARTLLGPTECVTYTIYIPVVIIEDGGLVPHVAGVVAPAAGVVAPAAGVLSPAAGEVAPAAGVVASAAGVDAPAAGVVSPVAGVVAPAAGVVDPASGVVAPAAGVVDAKQPSKHTGSEASVWPRRVDVVLLRLVCVDSLGSDDVFVSVLVIAVEAPFANIGVDEDTVCTVVVDAVMLAQFLPSYELW
jgi:hypothetical protein